MKSLADQLREELIKPATKQVKHRTAKPPAAGIIEAIKSYDNADHKTMVHVRFDSRTADLMNKFKFAAGVDVTKLVAFAVKHLLETYPEIKSTIKHYLQNTEL